DGTEAGRGDAGPGRAAGAGEGADEAGAEVFLGPVTLRLMSRVWGALLVGCLTLIACSPAPPPRSASTSPSALATPSTPISLEWAEYHRDPGRSGAGPTEPALTTPRSVWNVGVDADVYASPPIVAGHVLVATENSPVYPLAVLPGT